MKQGNINTGRVTKMKILNLYAGIGGNRKLWGDEHEITAVELNPDIAKIYHDFFPNDKVIVADAHQYLLEHFKEYDFIWSSPPCPTHSRIRKCNVIRGMCEAIYPDMTLYQEIILLNNFMPLDKLYVVENVIPYYNFLINPTVIIGRHPFWCNFNITNRKVDKPEIPMNWLEWKSDFYRLNISKYYFEDKIKQRQILRNLVNPEIGLHILNCALNKETVIQEKLFGDL